MKVNEDAGAAKARAGRPRDPRLDEAVVAATLQLLAEEGYAQLTVERIAARAGVGKASLYRRWPDKVSVVLEAVSRNPERPSVPDTGSLRGDALTYLQTLVRYRTLHFDAISAISGEALSNERFGDAFRAGMAEPIMAGMDTILQRAIGRGELPPRPTSPSSARFLRRCCRCSACSPDATPTTTLWSGSSTSSSHQPPTKASSRDERDAHLRAPLADAGGALSEHDDHRARQHHRERRAAHAAAPVHRFGLGPAVDRRRLPSRLRGGAAHHGDARRPLRAQAGAAGGPHPLRRRQRGRDLRRQRGPAHRAAHPHGPGRGAHHAGHAVDHHQRLPAGRARPRHRRVGRHGGHRHRPGSPGRRTAPRGLLVELRLPDQRPGRDRGPAPRHQAGARQPRSGAGRVRPDRRDALGHGADGPRVVGDRGSVSRLDEHGRGRRAGGGRAADGRVHRLGAPRRVADARTSRTSGTRASASARWRSRRSSSR